MNLIKHLIEKGVSVACQKIGLDFDRIFIPPIWCENIYEGYRWFVFQHSKIGPVIYALPPAGTWDQKPWETWYNEQGEIYHHIHYTARNPLTKDTWIAPPGTPDISPEVLGIMWYWYNDENMIPLLFRQEKR